jgi:hypothetical protein
LASAVVLNQTAYLLLSALSQKACLQMSAFIEKLTFSSKHSDNRHPAKLALSQAAYIQMSALGYTAYLPLPALSQLAYLLRSA